MNNDASPSWKVFAKGNLKTIFIDDPVQSMDELNTTCFIDLLRNEFKDYQVILSTHEEVISMFFRYKYKMSGKDSHSLNVQKQFYSIETTS